MSARRVAVAMTIVVSAVLLSSCGTSSDPRNTIDGEVSGDITVVTWRTDLIQDGTFAKYAEAFQELYPDVTVTFDGITDYEGEMPTRLSTRNYGDVIGIPYSVVPSQFAQFLEPLGETADLSETYRATGSHSYGGTQFGLPIGVKATGIVYNQRVFDQAGITDLPTSEDEWLDALRSIKDATDAVPFYTNYKDGWPLAEPFYNLGAVTNDPAADVHLAENSSPWTEGTDIYAVDSLLYETVAAGLTEKDPLTTNWEQSKIDLATGKIATMALGSWALSQIQAAAEANGASSEDIGYMPFPSNIDGAQYSVLRGDRNLGVSRFSEHKAAAWAFIRWLIEDSGFSEKEGMVSSVADKPLPGNLERFEEQGVELLDTAAAPSGGEDLLADVARATKIDVTGHLYRREMIDVARGAAEGDKESFFADLNDRWGRAVEAAAE